MQIELELLGNNVSENDVLSLEDWIKRERIQDLSVERQTTPADESHMGLDWLAVLTIVLGSKAIVELVKSLHVWIKATHQKKLRIRIKVGDDVLEIDSENSKDQEELLAKVLAKLTSGSNRPSIEA